MPDPIMFLAGMVMSTTAKGAAAGHCCVKLAAVMAELQSEKAKGLAIGKTLRPDEMARGQALTCVMGMIASRM